MGAGGVVRNFTGHQLLKPLLSEQCELAHHRQRPRVGGQRRCGGLCKARHQIAGKASQCN
jgi:hypothetical protein